MHPPIVTPHNHPGSRPLTSKPDLVSTVVKLKALLQQSVRPNVFSLHLPVASDLNIPERRQRLTSYHDHELCDFLEFGWPIGYMKSTQPQSSNKNHGSALAHRLVWTGVFSGGYTRSVRSQSSEASSCFVSASDRQ